MRVALRLRAHCLVGAGVARQFVRAHFSRTEIATSEMKLTRHKAGRVVN